VSPRSDYLFAGAVQLRVRGNGRVLRHFDAEYGEAAAPAGSPDVDVRIRWGTRLDPIPGGNVVSGGHKTARWRVALGPPDESPLRAELALAGGPPSFTLSLVQGYFVEALVAAALARAGLVALPSAAFSVTDGAVVLLGRSGAGKTTMTARALAAGRTVLSDDQVVIDRAGCVWRYPRRLRFYPDIRETVPEAWARLRPETRAALVRRGWLRRLTRGFVAPSLAVPTSEIGTTVQRTPLPLGRLVVAARSDSGELTVTDREPAWVVEQACLVLADQRSRISRQVGPTWARALDDVLATERRTLVTALADVPATEVVVPTSWGARQSVDALEGQLGLTTPRATVIRTMPPVEQPSVHVP
jgi:hypothetical protein